MKSDKDRVGWCLKQKRGIKLDEPNSTLCAEYLRKARSSLNMLSAAIEREEEEWTATIGYYARYYSVYALFRKCGIISEIHDCTLAAFGYFFTSEGVVDGSLYEELMASKEQRIDAQYYVMEEKRADSGGEAQRAGAFVLAIEEALERVDANTIKKIREKIKLNV